MQQMNVGKVPNGLDRCRNALAVLALPSESAGDPRCLVKVGCAVSPCANSKPLHTPLHTAQCSASLHIVAHSPSPEPRATARLNCGN